MPTKLKETIARYPKQFWLLYVGLLVSMIGSTMIWPLLLIYVSKQLNVPMTQTASLMTINAIVGVAFTFVAGSITDRFGRKWVVTFGLMVNAFTYLFMMRADTYLVFAIMMAFSGMANPLYRVGVDAMITDIIPEGERIEAFALIRMAKNLGVSLGPAIGGIIAAKSYDLTFISAAVGMAIFSIMLIFFAKETLPAHDKTQYRLSTSGGYHEMLKDRDFIAMISLYSFGWITSALMWILLPVYANQQFGIPENLYGWIPTTNGLMVIFFQVIVTNLTKRFRPLPMITLGMVFYAIGTGSVAFFHGFWGFWLSIVIITIGELIIVPTSSAYVANRSQPDTRGRYMSIYNLSWSFARGAGPLMGGWLSDSFGPVTIWYGGFVVGTLSSLGLLLLTLIVRRREQITV